MLVDECSAGAVVSHPRPEIGEAAACLRGQGISRVAQVVEVQAGSAITRYLDIHHLAAHITAIIGRDDSDPAR